MFTETEQEPLADLGVETLEAEEHDAPFIKNSQAHFASSTWIKYVLIISSIIAILALLDAVFLL